MSNMNKNISFSTYSIYSLHRNLNHVVTINLKKTIHHVKLRLSPYITLEGGT